MLLRWSVRHGADEHWLRQLAKATGRVPTLLAARPKERAQARSYWEAFWMLNGSRPFASGLTVVPLPIPLTEIEAYARLFGWHGEAREGLVAVIRQLDGEYLRLQGEKHTAPPSVVTNDV